MQKLTFLIVDDNFDDTEMLKEALIEINTDFHIVSRYDGSEAFEWLKSSGEKPYLIFLDLNMPRLKGFQCLNKLKQNEEWKHIPVVILYDVEIEGR